MKESVIERRLRVKVRDDLGGMALKFVSPGFNGVPDRIVLLPGGRVIFIETKAPRKDLRKLQKWVCSQICDLGFTVLKIDSIEGVDAFIEEAQAGGV